ncbi:SH3 domain-containing protein [Streptomyces sp. NBC_00080]|uniref:SH3 domain-containing protein n=1 Tax=Streptomyces sp. NBC_00080 TaxID=2975645 RepID=UPI00386EC76A
MPLRTALTRLAILTAAGTLAATAAVAPAIADDWDGDSLTTQDDGSSDWQNQGGGEGQGNQNQGGGGGQGNQNQGGGQGNQAGGGGQGNQNQGGGQGNQNQGGGQGNQAGGGGQGNQNQGGGQGNQNHGGGQGNQNQGGGQGNQNGSWQSGGGDWQSGGSDTNWQSDGGDWQSGNGNHNDSRRYRGRVTASELLLRSAPTRASQVIRVAHRGEIVSIFCKTPGQNVQGNSLWYLLTDGTWAWGSARYIDTIGTAPRWC